jgi:hypothetical protein
MAAMPTTDLEHSSPSFSCFSCKVFILLLSIFHISSLALHPLVTSKSIHLLFPRLPRATLLRWALVTPPSYFFFHHAFHLPARTARTQLPWIEPSIYVNVLL